MPDETVRIPDLPPATPDFNSFVGSILSGDLQNDEIPYRLAAKNGYAGDPENPARVGAPYRTPNGDVAWYNSIDGQSIPETRQVTPEQAEVIRIVSVSSAERQAKLKAAQGIELAESVLTQKNSSETINNLAQQGSDPSLTSDLQALVNLRGSVNDPAMFSFWGQILEPLKDIRWESEIKQHYQEIGLEVPEVEQRLQCCMIHIGLDAQAYFGYRRNWEWLRPVINRTLEVANLAP